MTLLEKLFGFQGRITRKDYWLYYLSLIGLTAVFSISVIVTARLTGRAVDPRADFKMLAVGLGVLTLWPSLAIGVKRCHDRDKSGWWLLLWGLLGAIPFVGILASLWSFVELGILDGTPGANRFGLSPKGRGTGRIGEIFA